ncbi:MAG: ATP-dependent zinc metalloprotease FtsH [Bdellovibrionaceae bacterium]|jgi:cell division protease FtsH|nr:ATP-dependent zinc metalloprotease FtsH [Pseudobdellovibrionaceae bacterium]
MENEKKIKRNIKKEFIQPDPVKINFYHIFLLIWLGMIAYQYYLVQNITTVSYSEFLSRVDAGEVKEVVISDASIRATLNTKKVGSNKFDSIIAVPVKDDQLTARLIKNSVSFKAVPSETFLGNLLKWLIPIAIIVFLWNIVLKKIMGSAGGGLLNFQKSKARVYVEEDIHTTFKDIAGVEEAKQELAEIVNYLKDPNSFGRLGGRAPKGILLVGPPGTGKTLMARAVAGEASVPFYHINGSEFVEMFVGMGAARVRDLFNQARKSAPCILFIDELDALGKARSTSPMSGANDEKEQTLNQLLAELDGFDSQTGIILLAATNRPEILDPALLRSGRFDRQVLIDKPDQKGRVAILKIHIKKVRSAKDLSVENIAHLTPGFSGADLENLTNEAALVATRRKGKDVVEEDFTEAIERIVAGLERKNRIINPEEKKRVAYHEMGHASVGLAMDCLDKVHKVSIIPRGIGALGYTLQRPTEDRYLLTKNQLSQKISVLLGGRVSEKIFFSDVSTGASDDLNKATDIARAMVTQYSMSDKVGLPTYELKHNQFLGGAPVQANQVSDATSQLIDSEVRFTLEAAEEKAIDVIEKNRKFIEACVQKLLIDETLVETDLKALWKEFGVSA